MESLRTVGLWVYHTAVCNFQVLKAVSINSAVFWVVVCRVVRKKSTEFSEVLAASTIRTIALILQQARRQIPSLLLFLNINRFPRSSDLHVPY